MFWVDFWVGIFKFTSEYLSLGLVVQYFQNFKGRVMEDMVLRFQLRDQA